MKKMEKAVILNKVGGVFSECMDIELQGIAKPCPDEKHKVAHAKCKVEFATAMGNKSTNPEADLSMHFSTLFENIRECADEPDEVARKMCRKKSKDAARAEGVAQLGIATFQDGPEPRCSKGLVCLPQHAGQGHGRHDLRSCREGGSCKHVGLEEWGPAAPRGD